MSNTYFRFKQFTIHQEHCAMKVCTDACLFGAWMSEAVGKWQITDGSVLDIGTGTGLLSLMLAQKTHARIDAIEIDEAAAIQAAENFDASPWRERLQLIQGDARTIHLGRRYELVISNPPFFENDLKSGNAQRNLALHSDALSFEELLLSVTKHIAVNGKLAVLLPCHRNKEFEQLARQYELYPEQAISVRQTPAHPYFRVMLLLGRRPASPVITSITIREEDQYTSAFTMFLKDYYLYL